LAYLTLHVVEISKEDNAKKCVFTAASALYLRHVASFDCRAHGVAKIAGIALRPKAMFPTRDCSDTPEDDYPHGAAFAPEEPPVIAYSFMPETFSLPVSDRALHGQL